MYDDPLELNTIYITSSRRYSRKELGLNHPSNMRRRITRTRTRTRTPNLPTANNARNSSLRRRHNSRVDDQRRRNRGRQLRQQDSAAGSGCRSARPTQRGRDGRENGRSHIRAIARRRRRRRLRHRHGTAARRDSLGLVRHDDLRHIGRAVHNGKGAARQRHHRRRRDGLRDEIRGARRCRGGGGGSSGVWVRKRRRSSTPAPNKTIEARRHAGLEERRRERGVEVADLDEPDVGADVDEHPRVDVDVGEGGEGARRVPAERQGLAEHDLRYVEERARERLRR